MHDSYLEPHIDYVVIPPDGGWGWLVVFVAFCWNMVVDGTSYTFALYVTEMSKNFKVNQALLMLASSIQLGIYFLLGPLVAAMINRFGFRIVSMIGGSIAFAGVLSTGYVENIYIFITTFGCTLGVAFSMTYMCNILIVGFYFQKYRAMATCIAVTGTPVGISLFPFIFSVLLPDVNWRDTYKYLSGAHLLMALFGLVYKPIPPTGIIAEAKGKAPTESSSLWDEWEREHPIRRLTNYPTTAEALESANYIIITPYDQDQGSKTSFKSTRTAATMRSIMPAFVPKPNRRKVCCCYCRCQLLCKCLLHDSRPMYRDDILYHGSTKNLSQYDRSQTDANKAMADYNMNVTRTSHIYDTFYNADCCNCCPDSVLRVLTTMLDFSLVKSFAFLFLSFSGFFTYLGIYVPYIYGIQLTVQHNIEKNKAGYVLTAMGISNCAGRILSGLVTTLVPKIRPIIVSAVTLVVAGVACIMFPFCHNFEAHIACACVFGFSSSTLSSLRTVVVVDLLGLEKLTNAFGLIVLLEGFASLLALPLNAFIYEKYQNEMIAPFAFSGIIIILSGFMLLPVEGLYKLEQKKALRKKQTNTPKVQTASTSKRN